MSLAQYMILDGVHPKTSPFNTHHLIWVTYKVVSQLSQPIFLSFLYLNSAKHNLVIELCCALKRRVPASLRLGLVSLLGMNCCLAPYKISRWLWGKIWRFVGMGWPQFERTSLMKPSIERQHIQLKWFHFRSMPAYLEPSQLIVTLWYLWKTEARWSACRLPTYLTPNSSTIRLNMMGRHLWRHRPGVVAAS